MVRACLETIVLIGLWVIDWVILLQRQSIDGGLGIGQNCTRNTPLPAAQMPVRNTGVIQFVERWQSAERVPQG
jgi:hypothetical protein